MKHNLYFAALLWFLLVALHAADPRVDILGDSITYSGRWPTMAESARHSTPPFAEAEIVNFRLASETVSGRSEQGYDAVPDTQTAWSSSQQGWQVIDIRHDLRSAAAGATQADPKFVYTSDNVHPGQQGHDFIAASLTANVPWDLPSLFKAPGFAWGEGKEVRSLYFTSEPYEGKPTRVFAYYATPGTLAGDTSKDKNLPGIVLVHGGGGKAFDGWARLWASRGYAAIAMDLSGNALGKPLPDGGPQQKDEIKFRTDAAVTDQWTYHAVAAVIRSHSLLRSFSEVDAKRTAITGISWGGYLTCIVAGLDDRFKAAVPVYGCGYLHVNSTWLNRFSGMPEEARAKWIQLWDPSNYVGSARMPMLFVNGGKDFAYPPDSHAMTYALVKSPKNLHFVPDLPHGHIFDRPSAIEIYIRQHLEGGTPLARIADPEIHANRVTAKVETQTKLVKAELHYTLDPLPGNAKTRVWISKPADIVEGTIQADLPSEKTSIWFLTVEDERKAAVSSRLRMAWARE